MQSDDIRILLSLGEIYFVQGLLMLTSYMYIWQELLHWAYEISGSRHSLTCAPREDLCAADAFGLNKVGVLGAGIW